MIYKREYGVEKSRTRLSEWTELNRTKDGSENADLTKWLNVSTFVEIWGDLEDESVETDQHKSEKYFGNMKPVKNNFKQDFISILCKLLY